MYEGCDPQCEGSHLLLNKPGKMKNLYVILLPRFNSSLRESSVDIEIIILYHDTNLNCIMSPPILVIEVKILNAAKPRR